METTRAHARGCIYRCTILSSVRCLWFDDTSHVHVCDSLSMYNHWFSSRRTLGGNPGHDWWQLKVQSRLIIAQPPGTCKDEIFLSCPVRMYVCSRIKGNSQNRRTRSIYVTDNNTCLLTRATIYSVINSYIYTQYIGVTQWKWVFQTLKQLEIFLLTIQCRSIIELLCIGAVTLWTSRAQMD